jgi:hypothetical protein
MREVKRETMLGSVTRCFFLVMELVMNNYEALGFFLTHWRGIIVPS